jgi:hypothetical protein
MAGKAAQSVTFERSVPNPEASGCSTLNKKLTNK